MLGTYVRDLVDIVESNEALIFFVLMPDDLPNIRTRIVGGQ